ncbi:hypothetical protein ACROYT_G029823 [Oculina patagonica]
MVEIQLPRQIIAIMDIRDTATVLLLQHISAPAPREATNIVEILEEIQLIVIQHTSTLGILEAADVLEIQTQIQRLLQTLKVNRVAREGMTHHAFCNENIRLLFRVCFALTTKDTKNKKEDN